jgi:starch phosphorylase
MVLEIGGWRILKALGILIEVCHLNEGYGAFVVFDRARSLAHQAGTSFHEAWWATCTGNVFTTPILIAAGFNTFAPELIRRYFQVYALRLGLTPEQLLALGRHDPRNTHEPFNMAILALRGSIVVNGVSQLHEQVSRRIFQPLFPRCPDHEVPLGAIANGVHVPSWDSAWADALWTA